MKPKTQGNYYSIPDTALDTLRGAYFGMFIDKLGISRMVHYDDPAKALPGI